MTVLHNYKRKHRRDDKRTLICEQNLTKRTQKQKKTQRRLNLASTQDYNLKMQHADRNWPQNCVMTLVVIAPFHLLRPCPCAGEHSFFERSPSYFLREGMTSVTGRMPQLVCLHRETISAPGSVKSPISWERDPVRARRFFNFDVESISALPVRG